MLRGWIAAETGIAAHLAADNFVAVARTPEKIESLKCDLGVTGTCDIHEIANVLPDAIVMAVKPQVMDEVLSDVKDAWFGACSGNTISDDDVQTPLVITVAAGIPTAHFEEVLGRDTRVVRVMPNMPLQVGQGATAVSAGKNATESDVAFVRDLFTCIGKAYVVDESQIDVVCALSGGGPAYVAYLIEALRDAGVAEGLDGQLAEQLAIQTISGTCALMDSKHMTPEEVRRAVCSPGGTTLAALFAMEESGFGSSVASGISAAIKRAQELAL